ncbi:helix-turn-helix transcriptional regulator [Solibacillus sp. FSL R7-0668]|uniref:helix-turn-helix domain-containing protein n=1 Tax=Solibacillus sp. FSL R7-0668 TaxID=2921688 RepID=UPI0030F7C694
MVKYGDRLRSLREGKGLSQKELADKLNINRSTYARYETSSTQPDYDILNAVANFYDVSVDYLLGRINEINKPLLSEKEERDMAKRMEKMKKDLKEGNQDGEGLNFRGEPMSEEAMESLLEALEHAERIATLANKKFAPNKYREKN